MSRRKTTRTTPHFPEAEVINLAEWKKAEFREETLFPDREGEEIVHRMTFGWPERGIPGDAYALVKVGPVQVGQLVCFHNKNKCFVSVLVARDRSGIAVRGSAGKVYFLKRNTYKIEGPVIDTDYKPDSATRPRARNGENINSRPGRARQRQPKLRVPVPAAMSPRRSQRQSAKRAASHLRAAKTASAFTSHREKSKSLRPPFVSSGLTRLEKAALSECAPPVESAATKRAVIAAPDYAPRGCVSSAASVRR